MSDHRHVSEPGELVYLPKPSWAPAFLVLGIIGLVCGTFASGFAFPPFLYAVIGGLIALLAFRALTRGAIRDYYRRPRRQKARGAALPVEQIRLND